MALYIEVHPRTLSLGLWAVLCPNGLGVHAASSFETWTPSEFKGTSIRRDFQEESII